MSDISTKIQLDEMKYFESLLTEEQSVRLRNTIRRIADIFRKRLKARKATISTRAQKVLGVGLGGIRFQNKPITDEVLMGYQYIELLAWLRSEEKDRLKAKEG
jgi:hypothetical protein